MSTPAPSWPTLLTTLLRGDSLDAEDAAWAMGQIMDGEATDAQVAGFVVALRAKGESPAEMAGLVTSMMARAWRLDIPEPAVDTCGTGGDRAHTVNISTMAAIVVAATGHRVVKHGNRAASSRCGSADLLEALGVAVDLSPDSVPTCVAEAGIGFCFAPRFHPALRHAAATRRELGVATVFNFLGPLANPAQPRAQAVGVADARMAAVMAQVLASRGSSALVFRGEDGLDELSVSTLSRVWDVADGSVTETTLDPTDLGVPLADVAALRGGDAEQNAGAARSMLAGDKGPVRDAVLLNAAAAVSAVDRTAGDLTDRMAAAMTRCAEAVDDGAAVATLDRWVAVSQALPKG